MFGPTEPAIYRPYDPTGSNQTGPFNIVVKPKVKSSTMGVGGWAGDLIQRPYMREIDSREIVEKVEQHLAAKRAT